MGRMMNVLFPCTGNSARSILAMGLHGVVGAVLIPPRLIFSGFDPGGTGR
jgi:hypothetical protein